VKFRRGEGVYHYHGVGLELFEQMQKSESLGKFIGAHIKPQFKVSKV
jgi:hypothetical protein